MCPRQESYGVYAFDERFIKVTVSGVIMSPKKVKVLIVDDQEMITELFSAYFERHGYTNVRTAHCEDSAKEALLDYNPDVLLMDTQVHPQYGPEIFQTLQKHGFAGLCYGMSGNKEKDGKDFELDWKKVGAKKFFMKMDIFGLDQFDKKFLQPMYQDYKSHFSQ